MGLVWRAEMATGIRAVDLQHEELVAMINALAEAVAEGEEMPMLESAKQFELAKNLALQLFEENMEQSMTLLKTWLKQEA